MPTTFPTQSYEQRFPAEPQFVAPVRHAVTDLARRAGLAAEALDDVALAVSEAVTNGVMHASARTIDVRVETNDGVLFVTITDDGVGMRPRSDSPGLGVGLPLIDRLCARLCVGPGHEGTGTTIEMAFDLPLR